MLISPSTHKASVDWVLHGPLILKGLDYNLQYFKVKVAVHAMHVCRFLVLTVILQEFIRLQSIFSRMCTHLLSRIYATESTLDKTSVKSKNYGIKLISKLVQAKKILQLHFRHFVFVLSYSFPGSWAVARDTDGAPRKKRGKIELNSNFFVIL